MRRLSNWSCRARSGCARPGRTSSSAAVSPVWSRRTEAQQINDPSFTGGATQCGVLAASKKQDLGFKLANWMLEPAQQAAIATAIAGFPAIPIDKLPARLQSEFASADPGNMRPGFNSDMDSDMKSMWQQKVPAH